jgi:hypothetical protein
MKCSRFSRVDVQGTVDSRIRDNYVMPPAVGSAPAWPAGGTGGWRGNSSELTIFSRGRVMELSNYEIVRYPSGQVVIIRAGLTPSGTPSSGPRDVIGSYRSDGEAQSALARLIAGSAQAARKSSQAA